MSLDTILQIGKALRNSKEGLTHFKYIRPCPPDTDKETILRLNIPVKKDFSFDWKNVSIIPENRIEKLLYLTFKTSDADGLVKYIFGDIYYELIPKISSNGDIQVKEGGYYRLTNTNAHGLYKKSSFQRGNEDFENIKLKYINRNSSSNINNWLLYGFRSAFEENEEIIEKILRNLPALHHFFSSSSNTKFWEFLNNEELINEYFVNNVIQTTTKKNLKKLFGEDFKPENRNQYEIETIKKIGKGKIFLHFDFNGKNWYEFDSNLELISEKMLDDFFQKSKEGYLPQKTLYKNLCSGDIKNDIQFPSFKSTSKHKSKYFSLEEAKNLFYAKEYSEKALFTIDGTDIKLIILPRGQNLQASDYTDFYNKANEKRVVAANDKENTDNEPLLIPLVTDKNNKITSFDFVFSKKGGISSPDTDLIELNGIEKSAYKETMVRINKIREQVKNKYGYKYQPKIEKSFLNILGSGQINNSGKVIFKTNPKYQSHILRVLPQIYSQNYYRDEILLPAFIEKVEFSIRAGSPKYNALKYYLEFLLSIRNNKRNKFMETTNSKSYQIGLKLGSLAKGLKNKINSFEKNYVGNLTRRISTINDCIKFKNEIEQKNIMHELSNFTRSTSNELSMLLNEIKESEYDKEQVAFGFFESYFKYETKKGFIEKLEKLLNDYASSEEEDTPLIQEISKILENYQNK